MLARYLYIFSVFAFLACSSKEDTKSASDNPVVAQLPAGNPVEGKALFTTCIACHGENGQGNSKLNAPALANLSDWYLTRQLMNFRNDIRGYVQDDTLGIQMAAMAKTLKDSTAVGHVVAYIKTMPEVQLPVIIKGDIKKGERTYQSVCGSCHGAGGKGNEKMNAPRLNGLDDWYLKSQIKKFQTSIRGAHPSDTFGAQMITMVASLNSDEAINDVIAYIRSTTQPSEK